tara:strand:- start:673 stop:1356 length:684 start_codon:yes stop_codon:yes gene_type:complete
MGDPKKLKKKYSTPIHPWNKTDIEENKVFKKEYGLKIRKELLLTESFLKKYKNIAKTLISDQSKQGEVEKKQMMDKLHRLGLLSTGAELDDVLSLELKDILERRLQSLVFRRGLAHTMTQARQFITHRHIAIGNKEITSPSYLVSLEEEAQLCFKTRSALANEDHPERVNEAKTVSAEAEAVREHIKEQNKKETEVSVEETTKTEPTVSEEKTDQSTEPIKEEVIEK